MSKRPSWLRFSVLGFGLGVLAFAGCGTVTRSLADVEGSVASPAGLVDATSAARMATESIEKDALLEAKPTPVVPTGFVLPAASPALAALASALRQEDGVDTGVIPDFFETVCVGIERNGRPVSQTVDLNGVPGFKGTYSVAVACTQDKSFDVTLGFANTCRGDVCYDGAGHYQLKAGKLVWSFRTEAAQSGARRTIDIGGVLTIGAPVADIKMVGFFPKAEDANTVSPVVLTWSALGVGKYSEYYVTGGNGRYRCNSADAGVSGCCRQLGSADRPTGEQFTWGDATCS